jgi:DNA-binding response OmpR family regulator
VKILVVDDDLELLGLIAYSLRQAGYLVIEAQDGPSGLEAVERERPDVVILDGNLPRIDGFEVLRRLRAAGIRTPVMMLTVRSSEEDQVHGLDLGADDYLTKPFSPRTLLARVRALLRRGASESASFPVATGELVVDPEALTVRVRGGEPVRLTRLEYRLLQFLLANTGQPVASERILTHVWGWRGMGDRQLLKQLVHRLRRKLERDPGAPRYLVTASGVGYALHPNGDAPASPAEE